MRHFQLFSARRSRDRLIASALLISALHLAFASIASGDGEFALPKPRLESDVAVEQALASRRSVREFASEALSLAAVSQLLWAAQGVTHPKGLRTAPSAGALYPLEVLVVVGDVSGLRAGVYRYEPRGHQLVLESQGELRARVAEAALDQEWIATAPAIVVLTAVYERTARKYRKRTERYVHIEAGHAAQNVYLQAEALGLGTTMVGAFHDDKLSRVLGLKEREVPIALLPVGKPL
ncbi:MAG: SagB/ThcOx family dehydrogenase [Deltaproteobacteria bacterium]|nr:SagB/ThcOx family dehydrogenase [Deltaproteobacteria bacterium]